MKLVNPLKKVIEAFQNHKQQKEAFAIHNLKARYHAFRIFLENNGIALEHIAHIDTQLIRGETDEVRRLTEALISTTAELVDGLNLLSNDAHASLYRFHGQLAEKALAQLDTLRDIRREGYCIPLDTLRRDAAGTAGIKAANLARLRRLTLPVPDGFVCTTAGTKRFLYMDKLAADIRRLLRDLERGQSDFNLAADKITRRILDAPLPDDLARDLEKNYQLLEERTGGAAKGNLSSCHLRTQQRGVRGWGETLFCRTIYLDPQRHWPAITPGSLQGGYRQRLQRQSHLLSI